MIKWFLAFFRLNQSAICELSTSGRDYHDYPDSVVGEPWHMYTHTCKHCNKEFTI